MAASPFAAYGAGFFSVEYRVNGLWNTLISQRFPQGFVAGSHLISPEAYTRPELTSGLRADLLVNSLAAGVGGMTISTPRLVYEGKGSNGDPWTSDGKNGKVSGIDVQLEDWLTSAAQLARFDCWVIGARGSEVKFWHWSDFLQEKQWDARTGRPVNGGKIYNITNGADWVNVLGMLHYMGANPA
jgi:hypothetical protein